MSNLVISQMANGDHEDSDSGEEVLPPPEEDMLQMDDDPEAEMRRLEDELRMLQEEEDRIRQEEEKMSTRVVPQPKLLMRASSTFDGNADKSLSSQLKSAIDKPDYSDFSLIAQGKKILVHKVILACRVKFFRKLFENNKAVKQFEFKDVKFGAAKALVDWIYTDTTEHFETSVLEDLHSLCGTLELYDIIGLIEMRMDPATLQRRKSTGTPALGSSPLNRLPSVLTESVETDKQRETRKKLATELAETEKTYVRSLQLIFEEIVVPLRTLAEQSNQPILTREEVNSLFSYWEVILKCHVSLLKVVQDRMGMWESNPQIGDIFLEKTAFIKLYRHYVNNYDKSISSFKHLKDTNHKFKDFMAKYEYTSKLQGLGLLSFLILPIQRIPRYVLLLQGLLKETPPSHFDYQNLESGLKVMKELADYINANKNDADEVNKILAIQQKLIAWPEKQSLVKPRRKLLREGYLSKGKDKYTIYLFTDALLYCKVKGKDKLKYKGFISLATSTLNTDSKTEKCDFEIIAQNGKFPFTALPEEKEFWIKTLSDTIENAHKELLGTAFSGFEKKDSDGSKQFQKLMEEDNLRKRSEMVVQMHESEQLYVQQLETLFKVFYDPILESLKSPYPMVTQETTDIVFRNIKSIYKSHKSFEQNLANRIATWDNASTIGDLFFEMVVDVSGHYKQFTDNSQKAVEALNKEMNGALSFATFVIQREKENSVSLTSLLEQPLKRLSSYYLVLEEFQLSTSETHPDYDKLKQVLIRLKEQLQQQYTSKIDELAKKSLTKGKSFVNPSTPPLNRRNSWMPQKGGGSMSPGSSPGSKPQNLRMSSLEISQSLSSYNKKT